jgi:hypothetical protein
MFLATLATKMISSVDSSSLMKAVKRGLGIDESSIIFAISPSSLRDQNREGALKPLSLPSTPSNAFFMSLAQKPIRSAIEQKGDIVVAYASCLDSALWKVGGAAVVLRLIQVANVGIGYFVYHNLFIDGQPDPT